MAWLRELGRARRGQRAVTRTLSNPQLSSRDECVGPLFPSFKLLENTMLADLAVCANVKLK